MKIKIKKLLPEAVIPCYAHPGDVGLDLYSLEDCVIKPGERKIFNLGFAMEFEIGYTALVKDRGSMSKNGLHTTGGVYDAGYRGEYVVQLINLGQESYKILKGDKIAQLIIMPVIIADLEETDNLSESSRGQGRWGSTGR
jgi:dUTP pyrophosphatase